MKPNIITISKAVILGLIISVGVGYISAAWSNPTSAPTQGNVDAPINVGGNLQTKTGSLWANFLGSNGNAVINGVLQIKGGTPGIGKVLTSDAEGIASWATSTSGGGTSSGRIVFGNYQSQPLPNTNTSTAVTVTGLTSGATGIIAFVNSNASCTDASAAWQIYTMSNVQIAGIGARVGGGESISAQDFQIIIPVTNSQFKYLTQGNCSGTLTVVGQIL